MTLSPEQVTQAAEDLFQAEVSGQQIGILSLRFDGIDMADAYAIQDALVTRKIAAGRVIKGWKIGLTSKAMQDALKIDIPDSGILFDDMFFADNAVIPKGRFIQPRIEAEIAFIMGADLCGENLTRDSVLQATASVAPALEILDTRILRVDPKTGNIRKVFDTIADNAANAGIVLGHQRHAVAAFDLRWVGAIVARDGEIEETGLGAGVLNDPVQAIVWLAQRLAQYGQKIRKGDVVLSGSFIRPLEAPSGAKITADFGPFGTVSCEFS